MFEPPGRQERQSGAKFLILLLRGFGCELHPLFMNAATLGAPGLAKDS
jgi:hypothetical protein